ncbi:hypothetical protein O181_022002 [Austropuccinia psidii MF-1]|uniref:Uncharacterized protein n=1 Tax=Austropuccinia psidii MF-1 TaxID=1389203 RepID=A0A9Q3CEN3_9BASI|nr:hypothetical protein [Austropuccinia psidii MF-1]
MSNSNRYKSNSEVSNQHVYEPVQTVLHSVQGQALGNPATTPLRSDELLAHSEKAPQRGRNSEILQWMESTIIQASNPKDKLVPCQKVAGCHNHGNPPSWTSIWHIHAISNIWKSGHIHNHWPNWPLSFLAALMLILSSGANLAPSPSSSHSRLSLCFWAS